MHTTNPTGYDKHKNHGNAVLDRLLTCIEILTLTIFVLNFLAVLRCYMWQSGFSFTFFLMYSDKAFHRVPVIKFHARITTHDTICGIGFYVNCSVNKCHNAMIIMGKTVFMYGAGFSFRSHSSPRTNPVIGTSFQITHCIFSANIQ